MSGTDQGKLTAILQALDSLADSMMLKATPIRFSVAASQAEKEAAYRLRYHALLDRGAVTPADFREAMELDEYDERAIQVLGWDGDRPIATGRLVTPAPGLPLPTEKAFGLVIEPRGEVVDIGRFTVVHELAQKEGRYFAGMLGFCWLIARKHGFIRVCGTASPGMLRHYRRLGFIVTELAPPHIYFGEERYPCWYDVVGSMEVLIGKWGSQDNAARQG